MKNRTFIIILLICILIITICSKLLIRMSSKNSYVPFLQGLSPLPSANDQLTIIKNSKLITKAFLNQDNIYLLNCMSTRSHITNSEKSKKLIVYLQKSYKIHFSLTKNTKLFGWKVVPLPIELINKFFYYTVSPNSIPDLDNGTWPNWKNKDIGIVQFQTKKMKYYIFWNHENNGWKAINLPFNITDALLNEVKNEK